jgi:hypothetical protein
VVDRILHNLSLLFERSFKTAQDLNRYRRELNRAEPAGDLIDRRARTRGISAAHSAFTEYLRVPTDRSVPLHPRPFLSAVPTGPARAPGMLLVIADDSQADGFSGGTGCAAPEAAAIRAHARS